ncbi:hypothetical protein [Deinococcus cellulosilyticus]|nr:hypothetical protein [Deinococcus cellulosilyticus]
MRITPQVVSNTIITSLFQLTVNGKKVEGPVEVQNNLNGFKQTWLNAGMYWFDPFLEVADNSKELELTVFYGGKQNKVRRTLNKKNFLPIPVIQKANLSSKGIETVWTAVPGAKSYLLQVVNSNNQTLQNWRFPATTTSLKTNFTSELAVGQTYSILLLAYGYDITLPNTTKAVPLGSPNVSAQITKVTLNKPAGSLASYSPTYLDFSGSINASIPHQSVQLNAGAAGLDFTSTITAGSDHFTVIGNNGSLGPSASTSISVGATCGSSTGLFEGELTLLTNDPSKSNIKIPLSVSCIQPGTLDGFSYLDTPLTAGAALNTSTTVNGWIRSGWQGLQYSMEVLSGKEFISVPAGVTSISSYANQNLPITLTCGNTEGTLAGKVRLKTNDASRNTIDFDVYVKCFKPVSVKELWSKPNNLSVAAAAWNPSGTLLAVADNNYTDGALLLNNSLQKIGKTSNLASIPGKFSWLSDTRLVINARDAVQVWDTTTNKSLHAWSHDFAAENVFSMKANLSKDQIAISGQLVNGSGLASIIYGLDGKKLITLSHVNHLTFSPDGQQMAGFRTEFTNNGNLLNNLVIYNTSDFKVLQDIDLSAEVSEFRSGFNVQVQWDPAGTTVFANVMEYYGNTAKLLTYDVNEKKLSAYPFTNMGTVNFAVPAADRIIHLDNVNQLISHTLSPRQDTKKVRLPVSFDQRYTQMSTDQQVKNISVFVPTGPSWDFSCSLQDFNRFNSSLELQDTYGVAGCDQDTTATIGSSGVVYVSNGRTARKLLNGKTSVLYDMNFLLNPTDLSSTHAIRENTGYFSDGAGYLYLYDLSKNSLIRSMRLHPVGMQQILPSADQKRVFSWSNSTIRVHDLATSNILLNKSFDEVVMQSRWMGPDSILLRNGQDSNGNYLYQDHDFVKSQVNRTYPISGWGNHIKAINDQGIFINSDYNIYRMDRQTGERTTLLNQETMNPLGSLWVVDNVYTLPRSQYILVAVHNTGTPMESRLHLMDSTHGTIMKTLAVGSSMIRHVSSVQDDSGRLLITVLFYKDGLQVFQID